MNESRSCARQRRYRYNSWLNRATGVSVGVALAALAIHGIPGRPRPSNPVPTLPAGKPNFNPNIGPSSGQQIDIETGYPAPGKFDIDKPTALGFGVSRGDSKYTLEVGASIAPFSGMVAVASLHGRDKLTFLSVSQLEQAPIAVPLGGSYELLVGATSKHVVAQFEAEGTAGAESLSQFGQSLDSEPPGSLT